MSSSSPLSQFQVPAVLGAAACAACCAVPLVGLAFGAGTASTFAAFVEPAAGISLAVAAVFVGMVLVAQRRAAASCATQGSCSVDGSCGCSPRATSVTPPV
jgi:hypothetical protein